MSKNVSNSLPEHIDIMIYSFEWSMPLKLKLKGQYGCHLKLNDIENEI